MDKIFTLLQLNYIIIDKFQGGPYMKVYRSITTEELTNLYQNEHTIEVSTTKGENTHNYLEGVEYIHFFKYSQSAEFYHTNNLEIHNPHIVYMTADIPNNILNDYLGYGYYNSVTSDREELIGVTIPLPEYAIPKSLFIPKYVIEVNNVIKNRKHQEELEYDRYLEYVIALLEKYDYNHYTVGRILHNTDLEKITEQIVENPFDSKTDSKDKYFQKIK